MTYNELVNLNNRNKEIFKNTNYDKKAKEFCKYRIEKREDGYWWGTPVNGLHRFDVCFYDITTIIKFFEEITTFHIVNVSKFREDLTFLNKYYLNYKVWCELKKYLKDKSVKKIHIKRVTNLYGYLGKSVLDGFTILFNNNIIACIYKDGLCEIISDCVIKVDDKTDFKFSYFDYISDIRLSNIDISSITNLSEFFIGCLSLENVELIGLNTKNVIDFGRMFEGCVCLKSLDLRIINTQSAKKFDGMFRHCLQIEYLNLSSFKTDNVEDIREMFCRCKKLVYLNINGWNLCNCVKRDNLFLDCNKSLRVDK